MTRTRYIFRAAFILLAVILLVDLNRRTDDQMVTVADFKFKTIEKLRTDSLDAKHKLDLVLTDTAKFVDNSSHVRKSIHYLLGLLGLWVIVELIFFLLLKRNYDRPKLN